MHTLRLHRTGVLCVWRVLFLVALCTGLLLQPARTAHATGPDIGLITAGSITDQGFNQMAYEGLLHAQTDFGIVPHVYESTGPGDYATNVQDCIDEGNVLCTGVSFVLADAVHTAAADNPTVNFAIIDSLAIIESSPGTPPLDNLRGVLFNEKQVGYLAGALAGRMTTSKTVGGIGGGTVPGVVAFMSGYQNGAQCAAPDVEVLLNYTGTFTDPGVGEAAAEEMITGGADVIFAPAGPVGAEAIEYASTAGTSGVWVIGVDSDQYYTVFGGGTVAGHDKLLTSAMKRVDNAVYNTVSNQVGSGFTPGNFTYDLSDGGVGLAPYHDADGSISAGIKAELVSIQNGIIAETIDIDDPCRTGTKLGLVTDTAGAFDDGFNNLAYMGLLHAQAEQGIAPALYEPAESSEYETQIQKCVDDGNRLCLTVGYGMADPTVAVASLPANQDTHFALLGETVDSPPGNLRAVIFDQKQAGYLAGALAGKMTASDTIGDIGGMAITPVVNFVEGFQNGAQCASAGVNVLMNYTGDFGDPSHGADVAADMISRGADVIFAAAGGTGVGAIQYSAGEGVWSIGVDTDQYTTVFGGGSVSGADKLLSSAMLRYDNAVYTTIQEELAGTFSAGTLTGDLSNGGVSLAPYHEADASIPVATQQYIDDVSSNIQAGDVDVNYPCQPRFHAEIVENDVLGFDWYPGWSIQLTIDDTGIGTGPEYSGTQTVDSNGRVVFGPFGGLQLAPGMVVTMSHEDSDPAFTITKIHTITTTRVMCVDPATEIVEGTGPEGALINVQHCDGTGCSWRRWGTVVSGHWSVNFKVHGPGDDEKLNLNIVPGMVGEAVEPDADGDHTDYQWQAPDLRTATYRSTGTQDGWILETGEGTNIGGTIDPGSASIRLGDEIRRQQYRVYRIIPDWRSV